MAIKPNDCIIRVEDLVIGTKEVTDAWDNMPVKIPQYAKYWENFSAHVDKINTDMAWNGHGKNPWDKTIDVELAKHGAKFKRTKEWHNNYIKFKSHKHLTMFIMRWS
jgi:hypothetical protein